MINTIQGIVDAAKGGASGVIAVAAAHDEPCLLYTSDAADEL